MNSDPFPLDDPPRSNRTTAARPGYETAQFGRRLAASLQEMARYRDWVRPWRHECRCHVAATKGFFGKAVKNLNRLADIDVLVASDDGKARLLIEIEERACSPKKILGDVLAAL
jgi:hypothetical protein